MLKKKKKRIIADYTSFFFAENEMPSCRRQEDDTCYTTIRFAVPSKKLEITQLAISLNVIT